ncbi:mitochondrial 54S ribosomal protein mL57 [Dipodascopsis tothii]|uniref:mitochondrial 54S ribosomal protein mL57 n=1 Tax=Dipodascopsis tothii TaxID=44089 RepID=UPI0034CDE6FB
MLAAWTKITGGDAALALPSELLQQVFTHKSYKHGFLPYNERLSTLGRKLFYLHTALYTVNYPNANPTAIAGKNVDVLNTTAAVNLLRRNEVVARFARANGFLPAVRWRKVAEDAARSGETTVLAHTIFAAVGAVALHLGGPAAEKLCVEHMLTRPDGLIAQAASR